MTRLEHKIVHTINTRPVVVIANIMFYILSSTSIYTLVCRVISWCGLLQLVGLYITLNYCAALGKQIKTHTFYTKKKKYKLRYNIYLIILFKYHTTLCKIDFEMCCGPVTFSPLYTFSVICIKHTKIYKFRISNTLPQMRRRGMHKLSTIILLPRMECGGNDDRN